ncbi:MAG: hypothetical protein AB7E49_05755 [Campylobacterales bacterium]
MKTMLKKWGFWIGAAIAIAAIGLTSGEKDTRLPCQKEVVCFDRWRDNAPLIQGALDRLAEGNYALKGRQEYARYMKSDLEGALSIEAIDALFAQAIGIDPKPGDSPLTIDYRLIENDQLDPAKKNPPKNPFSGYLLVSFKQDKQEVYRFQIDYLDPKAADLPGRIRCAVDAFKTGGVR